MSLQSLVKTIIGTGKYNEKDLAAYVGVSRETIRRIKVGKTKKTSFLTSRRIMSLYFFLEQENKNNKSF